VGVGHNEDPFAYMGGTDEGRWYAVPFDTMPERGQATKNVFDGCMGVTDEPTLIVFDGDGIKESWRVLQEDEPGS